MAEVQCYEFMLDLTFSIISENTLQLCEDLQILLCSQRRVTVEIFCIYLSHKYVYKQTPGEWFPGCRARDTNSDYDGVVQLEYLLLRSFIFMPGTHTNFSD